MSVRSRPAPTLRPPRQARSRATLDRLLEAAQGLLAERRFEDATVADLVRRAGSSVGAFYTRFRDKQALLQHFDQRFFDRGRELWESLLDPVHWRGASVAQIVTVIVAKIVGTRRQNQGLLRALGLYVRNRPDPRFRERAARLNRFVAKRLADLLLARRGEIRHSDPRRAVAFGLFLVDSASREAILFEDTGLNPRPMPDRRLADELARAYLSYLGVEPAAPARRTPALTGRRGGRRGTRRRRR